MTTLMKTRGGASFLVVSENPVRAHRRPRTYHHHGRHGHTHRHDCREHNPEMWSKGVHVKSGALTNFGYCVHCGVESRHTALERSVKADGYAPTIRRLLFLHNISGRVNADTKKAAAEDIRWLKHRHTH